MVPWWLQPPLTCFPKKPDGSSIFLLSFFNILFFVSSRSFIVNSKSFITFCWNLGSEIDLVRNLQKTHHLLFPPKTTCINPNPNFSQRMVVISDFFDDEFEEFLLSPWGILIGFIKVRHSPWINPSSLPSIQHSLPPSEMVNINKFPSEETTNSNRSDRNNLRTPMIRNEIENEDRIFLLGNTSAGDGASESINYRARSGSLRLGDGDIESIFDYFAYMQKQDANFFYVTNMNEECCLRNVFWADGRSQALYESFGDVVSFDSTYLNNDYKLPLVSIVGVNHHGQLALLGCGILFYDDKESYMWLFRSWLKCMCGRPPKAIVIDQCPLVQSAVSEVFPETRHGFFLRDVMETISKELYGLTDYLTMKNALESSVFESCTEEEFEESWNLFIVELKLENNDRLKTLYLDREKWVPAFIKTNLWAGISSCIEQNDGFFDGHIQPETTLKQFMEQFNGILRSKIEEEEYADSLSSSFVLPKITAFSFEKQFQDAYTNEKYMLFQKELLGLIYCNAALVSSEGPIFSFKVKDHVKMDDGLRRPEFFEVIFDVNLRNVWCECYLFESQGILCRHAVAVLIDRDVYEFPSCYILSRWRKDINRMHKGVGSYNEVLKTDKQMVCFSKLRTACHSIAEIGAETEEGFELAMKLLDKAKKIMLEQKSENSRQNEGPSGSLTRDRDAVNDYGEELQSSLAVRRRGRPPTKKHKGNANSNTLTINASFGDRKRIKRKRKNRN